MKDNRSRDFNLEKDYLTLEEAAAYLGVSVRQFRDKRGDYGLMWIPFMGKQLYRRTDLAAAVESRSLL